MNRQSSTNDYDGSQKAIRKWLNDNPVGEQVNGGVEKKYNIKATLDELKLLRDVESQAKIEEDKHRKRKSATPVQTSIDLK